MQKQWFGKLSLISSAGMLLLSLGLVACSSFSLTNSWRSPDFKGPPVRKVLVVGLSSSDASRRLFEDAFAQALKTAKVDATSSYGPLPEKGQISDERLREAVKQVGADSVLVTRVLKTEQKASVTQPVVPMGAYSRGGFYGWYGSAWAAGPMIVDTYNVMSFESTLWDMKHETVIWTGVTEALQPTDVSKATAEMSKVLIDKMKKDSVI